MTFPPSGNRGKTVLGKTHPVPVLLVKILLAVLAFTCWVGEVLGCKKSSPSDTSSIQTITITYPEKIPIKALFYAAHQPTQMGALIMASTPSELYQWDILAARLQQSGLTCIVAPLSPENGDLHVNESDAASSPQQAQRFLSRIDSGRRALVERGVQPENIALIAGDSAAFAALLYAVSRPEIAAVVLLSPPINEFGQNGADVMNAYGKRACLIMAAEGDTFAAAAAHTLKQAAIGFCELRIYSGSAHGVDLLHSSEQAREQILVWLKEVLGLP